MKKFFTLIAVAAMAFAAQAADWTAADGTADSEYAPVYGYNFETDQHNQMQYPAAELTGLASGTEITGVKFYTRTPSLVNGLGGTVTISLANMDDVTPWQPDAWGGVYGDLLDVAVTAVATVAPAADEDGVWAITFNAPFTYTGGALLIDVQSIAGTYQDTYFYGKEMDSYLAMALYGYSGTTKKGQAILPKVTFTYEGGGEEPGIATLAEANALEDAAEFTFDGDAVVTVFKNNYMFLRDESGYGMIPGVTGEFENGQVLSQGWSATKTTNEDGWVRYTDAAGLSASGETNAELAAAQVLTIAPDETMINAYVVFQNVTFSMFQRNITLEDGTTKVSVYDMFNLNYPGGFGPDNRHWNFYGIIGKNGDQVVLYPTEFVQYVEPTYLRGDVNHDNTVSIGDVTALIDLLLEGVTFDNPGSDYDCNLDQNVSIGDVTALIDRLLSGSWED